MQGNLHCPKYPGAHVYSQVWAVREEGADATHSRTEAVKEDHRAGAGEQATVDRAAVVACIIWARPFDAVAMWSESSRCGREATA